MVGSMGGLRLHTDGCLSRTFQVGESRIQVSFPGISWARTGTQSFSRQLFHDHGAEKKLCVPILCVAICVEKTEGTEGHTKFSQPGLRGEARFRHEAKALKTLCANFFVCRFPWRRNGVPRGKSCSWTRSWAPGFVPAGFHMPTSSPANFWQRGKTPRGKIRRSSKRKSLLKGPQNG